MDIIIRILMGLEAVICLMLIGIVLIQRSKGQGVGLSFGGGAEAVFGAQMGNVLTRATVVLGVIFLLNTAVLAILKPTVRGDSLSERMASDTPVEVKATAPTAEDSAAALELLEPDMAAPAPASSDAVAPAVEVVAPSVQAPAEEAPAAVAPAVVVPAAAAPVVKTPVAAPAEAVVEPAEEAPAETM